MTHHPILPAYLLEHIAAQGDAVAAERARETLSVDARVRATRELRSRRTDPAAGEGIVPPSLAQRLPQARGTASPGGPTHAHRDVFDAQHKSALPGIEVRAEGQRAGHDVAVNEAYAGLGDTWRLYHDVYGRDSLDGLGYPLRASVHFQRNYDNAFFNGEQMVFGDGDGVLFTRFTDSVDVIGHELTHGVTQFTAGLVYVGQSGALNESISDVFGALTEQYARHQSAAAATWLIGAKLFKPSVKGVALRSMKAPGTAYDDPVLGKDPQPAHMRAYQDLPHDEAHDNGGVHINSGIPNHAFYLFATALGGNAWERAGRVWYDTLTSGTLPKDADFATFAAATVKAAGPLGADARAALVAAWRGVGVHVG